MSIRKALGKVRNRDHSGESRRVQSPEDPKRGTYEAGLVHVLRGCAGPETKITAQYHIVVPFQKALEYKRLLGSDEVRVVHFTCQDDATKDLTGLGIRTDIGISTSTELSIQALPKTMKLVSTPRNDTPQSTSTITTQ
ncbi:23101_t:CDS:2 [Gigaspora rosea]|nr:23101_t:CDS:2 [Gigaspora rosea]